MNFTYVAHGFRICLARTGDVYQDLLELKFGTWYPTRELAQTVLESTLVSGVGIYEIIEDSFALPWNIEPADLIAMMERIEFHPEEAE